MESIVEFRAGCMTLAENRLSADPRKGLIRVFQDETGLAHFCWFERNASGAAVDEPEKDIVIIPGECTFGKIVRPGSRIFELRFPEERDRNLFFWAQEVLGEGDDDYVAAINLALNPGEVEEGRDAEDEAVGMDADAPAAAGAGPAAAASGGASGGMGGLGGISGTDLAVALGNILSGNVGQGVGAAAQQQQQRRAIDFGPSLSDVLRPEVLAPLLQSPDMVQRLVPYLPEEHRSAAAISELVSTPQFQHQLDLFSHALMTGQLDTSQFGLPPGGGSDVLDFLRSIQAQADAQQQQQQGGGGSGGTQP